MTLRSQRFVQLIFSRVLHRLNELQFPVPGSSFFFIGSNNKFIHADISTSFRRFFSYRYSKVFLLLLIVDQISFTTIYERLLVNVTSYIVSHLLKRKQHFNRKRISNSSTLRLIVIGIIILLFSCLCERKRVKSFVRRGSTTETVLFSYQYTQLLTGHIHRDVCVIDANFR